MNKERTVITQELCDHVKALLAGGLTLPNAAKFAKIGEATVGRIKAAGFDARQYAADTDRRRIQAQNRKAEERKRKAEENDRRIEEETKELKTELEVMKAQALTRKQEQKEKAQLIVGKYFDERTKEWTPATAEQLAKAMAPGAGMEQVPGQLEMQLTQTEEEKHEEIETWLTAIYNQQEQIIEKLDGIFIGMEGIHRYIAGKTDLLSKTLGAMMEKMDKQTDYLGQILRRADG